MQALNVKETVAGIGKNWIHSLFMFPTSTKTSAEVKGYGAKYYFDDMISFLSLFPFIRLIIHDCDFEMVKTTASKTFPSN